MVFYISLLLLINIRNYLNLDIQLINSVPATPTTAVLTLRIPWYLDVCSHYDNPSYLKISISNLGIQKQSRIEFPVPVLPTSSIVDVAPRILLGSRRQQCIILLITATIFPRRYSARPLSGQKLFPMLSSYLLPFL